MQGGDSPDFAGAPSGNSWRLDGAEAVANAAVGLVVSWLAVRLLFPALGWPVDGAQALGVSLLFFGLSVARAWVVRRVFRGLGRG